MKSVMEVCSIHFSALIMLNLWPLKEGEDAVQFANRVKSAIARQGGLTELPWWVMPSLLGFMDYLLLVFWQITFYITLFYAGENEGAHMCMWK